MRKILLLCLLSSLPFSLWARDASLCRRPDTIRLGYVLEGVPQYNVADLKIAYKKLLKTYARQAEVQTDIIYYERAADAVEDFCNRKIDSIGGFSNLWAHYYHRIVPKGTLFYIVKKSRKLFRRYLLLKRIGYTKSGGRVTMIQGDYNTYLFLRHYAATHMHRCADHCFDIDMMKKNSSAIYRLFFGQADFAVVPEESWKMAKEMNPQVKKRIEIVAASPAVMIVGAGCYANDLAPDILKVIKKSNEKVMHSQIGRDLLLMVQLKGQVLVPPGTLLPFIDYVEETQKLMKQRCFQEDAADTTPFKEIR